MGPVAGRVPLGDARRDMFKKRTKKSAQPQSEDEDAVPGKTLDAILRKRSKIATAKVKKAPAREEEASIPGDLIGGALAGSDQRATATAEWDTEHSRDHRAQLERDSDIGKKILAGELEAGLYRGAGAYAPVLNRSEGAVAAGKYTGLFGPIRSNQHARLTMRIDYNPEICKDYKETGYCGYGDTCIFIHDRSDYKSGWQLEKEWEEREKLKMEKNARRLRRHQRRLEGKSGESSSSSDESVSSGAEEGDEEPLPFACAICQEKWTPDANPVRTLCVHYFHEGCALRHFKKSSRCFTCGQLTNGVFNPALKLEKKIKQKQRPADDAV